MTQINVGAPGPTQHGAVRILVASPYPLTRAALRELLKPFAGTEVAGECDSDASVFEAIARLAPDTLILDPGTGDAAALSLLRQLRAQHPQVRILLLMGHYDTSLAADAVAAGVTACLSPCAGTIELASGLRALERGETYVSAELLRVRTRQARAEPDAELSERQRQLLEHIAEGCSNREIAQRLAVSVKTVETHRARLIEKLNLSGASALLHYALRQRAAFPAS